MTVKNREISETRLLSICLLVLGFCSAGTALGQMRITEYMYSGVNGEFIEFTNVGTDPIDMTGWSYDDDSVTPGTVNLSAFGIVAGGESVILTEALATQFTTAWGLSGIDVIGGNLTARLGRNDQINLFDSGGVMVDRLTFGDEDFPGSIRTQNASGWICAQALGTDDPYGWVLSTVGDQQASHASIGEDIGNPGAYVAYVCPGAPSGACCAAGVCSVTTQAECVGLGLWQGADTNCQTTQCPLPTNAQVRITEYMYTGASGEFVEFTNLGPEPVDMDGWSYDDDSREPGKVSLSGFGVVAAGDSVILTQLTEAVFLTEWHNPVGAAIIGDLSEAGLASNDELNLYDNSGALVDRLTYGSADFAGSVHTAGASGWPCDLGVGTNDIYQWSLSAIGDAQTSLASVSGDIGNPGTFTISTECPTGSCCVAGSCMDLSKADCALNHGLFLGIGTNCATEPCPAPSAAVIRITEFMYAGAGGEFVEFTNLGSEPADMTGWSFTDNANLPGAVDLSGFGALQPFASVVLAEESPTDPGYSFSADWNLSGTRLIIISDGELGRNDWIHLYDSSGSLVDLLQYGDEDFLGSIRTLGRSGWPCGFTIGQNNVFNWILAYTGDAQSCYVSSRGDIGSPGTYVVDCCGQAIAADLDCDGDVDSQDFAVLGVCLLGPDAHAPHCVNADLDSDGDVDLVDFAAFHQEYTGSM